MSTLISVVIDAGLGIKGYLAIDSTVNGRSYGGFRMTPDISPTTLAKAARIMTLKHGFLRLPLGGAKAAIVADPGLPLEEKRKLFKAFGKALRPFLMTRSYVPGADLGTTDDDIRFMLVSIGLKVRPKSLTGRSGFYSGITVFAAGIAAAQHIGLELSHALVAIEGFGSVGASAAHAFWKRGLKVVAISNSKGAIYDREGLDVGELITLRERMGDEMINLFPRGSKIDKSRLAELDVDIFCPCAQPYSITSDNASRVVAKIISPGANVPVTPEAEQILFRRGILSIPDFVANCGGALGVTMEVASLRKDFIIRFIDHRFRQTVTEIIEAAQKENIICWVYAERIAEERFLGAKEAAEKRTITAKSFNLALELYRKGIIPSRIVTPITSRYFERSFRKISPGHMVK